MRRHAYLTPETLQWCRECYTIRAWTQSHNRNHKTLTPMGSQFFTFAGSLRQCVEELRVYGIHTSSHQKGPLAAVHWIVPATFHGTSPLMYVVTVQEQQESNTNGQWVWDASLAVSTNLEQGPSERVPWPTRWSLLQATSCHFHHFPDRLQVDSFCRFCVLLGSHVETGDKVCIVYSCKWGHDAHSPWLPCHFRRGSSCWLMSGHAEAEDPCIWFRTVEKCVEYPLVLQDIIGACLYCFSLPESVGFLDMSSFSLKC